MRAHSSQAAAISLSVLVTGAGVINIAATQVRLTGFEEMILSLGMTKSLWLCFVVQPWRNRTFRPEVLSL